MGREEEVMVVVVVVCVGERRRRWLREGDWRRRTFRRVHLPDAGSQTELVFFPNCHC